MAERCRMNDLATCSYESAILLKHQKEFRNVGRKIQTRCIFDGAMSGIDGMFRRRRKFTGTVSNRWLTTAPTATSSATAPTSDGRHRRFIGDSGWYVGKQPGNRTGCRRRFIRRCLHNRRDLVRKFSGDVRRV